MDDHPPALYDEVVRELLITVLPAVAGMSVVVAVNQWRMEAQTRWMARLSARRLIESDVTPWKRPRTFLGGLVGDLRWLTRQRANPRDLRTLPRRRCEPDSDRATEVWRVRMQRRSRLTLWLGVTWLAWCCLFPAAFGIGQWRGVAVVAAVVVAIASLAGRKVYARARRWGEYED